MTWSGLSAACADTELTMLSCSSTANDAGTLYSRMNSGTILPSRLVVPALRVSLVGPGMQAITHM